ncbi:MAG: histidine kinase [Rufibacter sp.]
MNQAQIDFQQLRIKHILFKSKVRSVLYGGLADEDFFSRTGPIPHWFSSIGFYRYPGIGEMVVLKQVQQELDTAAQNLFDLYAAGKIDQAQRGLSEIESLSVKFQDLISYLERKLAA